MKVIGIIAEYNPFHNGHAYQIAAIREKTGADYVVVAMSGDFVQRGAPAIIDKYARAKMALACGADFVLELPVLWATASAESFAMAGVTLFEKMGCMNGICFGAETDDLPLLTDIAALLVEEPQGYRDALSSYLKSGFSFPAARAKAICDYLAGSHAPVGFANRYSAETIDAVMNEPNNILAVEYLKAIQKRGRSLTPYLIKREGAGYHDISIYDAASFKDTSESPSASATAIRNLLLHSDDTQALAIAMPDAAHRFLSDYLTKSPALYPDDFSQILGYRLLCATPESLAQLSDCSADIANRLYHNRHSFYSYERFIEQNKSKDITYTRLSRILLHLLLGIDKKKEAVGKSLDYITYLRMLGFCKSDGPRDCTPLLTTLKESALVPVISKLADAKNRLPEHAFCMLEDDIFAATLYEQVKFQKQQQNPLTYSDTAAAKNEYAQGLVLL